MSNDFDTVQHLLPLASQRYAVDVLDALSERPHTYAELRKCLRAHRRGLDDAMRALTTHGAIRRSGHGGSWDQRAPGSTRYQLTLPANGARVTVGRFAAVGGLNRTSNLVEPRPGMSRV